jgi:hypothetical protein
VWLWAPQSRALIIPREGRPNGGSHILVQPLTDEPVVLEVPRGVTVGLEAEILVANGGAGTIRVSDPATIRLSNGVRLVTRRTRVTLVEKSPDGERRIFLEPLPTAPALPSR